MSQTSQESQEKPGGNTKNPRLPQNQLYRWFITLPAEECSASQLGVHLRTFCKKFTFQKEKGEQGFEHWQIEISLGEKMYFQTVKNILGFDKAHIEPTKNYFMARSYCSKAETRLEGPYTESTVFIKTITHLRDWQKNARDLLLEEPDDRTILWYVDEQGNKGKSQFCKYMAVHHAALIFNNASFKDIACALPDPVPSIVMFNFTRDTEERINYSAIEAVKDGMMFSGKYESKTKIFNSPHIICFSNFRPDTSKMSQDRWKIKYMI